MSRKILRPRPEGAKEFFLRSNPCVRVSIRDFPISADSSRWRDNALRLLTQTSSVVVSCQPWFYLRLRAYSFFWLSECEVVGNVELPAKVSQIAVSGISNCTFLRSIGTAAIRWPNPRLRGTDAAFSISPSSLQVSLPAIVGACRRWL